MNSGDWVKKLLKNKNKVQFLDIDLEFGGGKYFASLRLSRGYRGILEVVMHLFITKCTIYLAYILVARACVANKMSSHSYNDFFFLAISYALQVLMHIQLEELQFILVED